MKKNILIVDDEADIRLLFSTELEDAGYKVFSASNSTECYQILASEKIDLCLLDIKLKNESGIDILQKVTTDYPNIRTLMASAYSAYQDDLSTWQADGYWVKSQDLDSLKDEVTKALNKNK
ncbi:MAG: response regulator [Deferribacteraceae bacterium]|jgi:DNA-binding NtrC family response regulator|nr:response regulator [Deferribacteraceae bacterium]